jgi:hypothetical protein
MRSGALAVVLGPLMTKLRRAIPLVAAAAVAWITPAVGAAELPSHAEIDRAGERFLERQAPGAAVLGPARPKGPADAIDLDSDRVVALYGAPQMGQTILGLKSVAGAARKLRSQASAYKQAGSRPVRRAFDLVATFATAGGGPDGLYRSRQDDDIIDIYLRRARASGARLILDIQPGRSKFLRELRALREWIVQPDVDVAIDAEWNVGRRGVPGETLGKVTHEEVAKVQRYLARTVREESLPPKLLLVHQFRRGSVRGRGRIRQRDGVQTLLNFDGIGAPGPKASGYEALSARRLYDGFSLFYRRDEPLMSPARVLALEPEPDFLLYQ